MIDRRENGFSMVELVVAIFISAIVISIALTAFTINIKYITMESLLSESISSIEAIVTPLRRNLKNTVVDFWADPLTTPIGQMTTSIRFKSMGASNYVSYHYFIQNKVLFYTMDGGVKHRLLEHVTNMALLADDVSSRVSFPDAPAPNPNATVIDGNGFSRTIRSYTIMIEVFYPSMVKHTGKDFSGNKTLNSRYHRYIQFYAPAAYI